MIHQLYIRLKEGDTVHVENYNNVLILHLYDKNNSPLTKTNNLDIELPMHKLKEFIKALKHIDNGIHNAIVKI